MQTLRPGIVVAVTIVLLTLVGCQSMQQAEETPQAPEAPLTNRLTMEGHTVRLPAGWEFFSGNEKGLICSFRSPESITGSLETISLDPASDVEGIIEYYLEMVFESELRPEVSEIATDTVDRLVSIRGRRQDRSLLTLISQERERLMLLHLSAPEEVQLESDNARRLLDNHSYEDGDITIREQPGGLGFVSADDTWRWVADYQGGLLFYHEAERGRIYAGLFPLNKELFGLVQDETIPLPLESRLPRFLVSTAEPEVYYDAKTSRVISLYSVLRTHKGEYLLSLTQREEPTPEAMERALLDPAVRDLLDFYVSFPDSGGES